MAIFLSVESEMLVSLPPRFKMYSKEAGKMQFPEVRNAHNLSVLLAILTSLLMGCQFCFEARKQRSFLLFW